MTEGLIDEVKWCLLLNCEDDTGLFIADVLEISKLISELFSLPLLQYDLSISFLRLLGASFVPLPLRTDSCTIGFGLKKLGKSILYLQMPLESK